MSRQFLNIVIAIDSNSSTTATQEMVRSDIEYFYADRAVNVFEVSHDNAKALDYLRRLNLEVEKIGIQEEAALSHDVTAVLEAYKLSLPPLKRGAPAWKVPSEPCYGKINALDNINGKLVLTNGIKAFIVREDGRWYDVHLDWFVPDNIETLPEEFRFRKPRKERVLEDFNVFNLEAYD